MNQRQTAYRREIANTENTRRDPDPVRYQEIRAGALQHLRPLTGDGSARRPRDAGDLERVVALGEK